jgi:hypothetical protein
MRRWTGPVLLDFFLPQMKWPWKFPTSFYAVSHHLQRIKISTVLAAKHNCCYVRACMHACMYHASASDDDVALAEKQAAVRRRFCMEVQSAVETVGFQMPGDPAIHVVRQYLEAVARDSAHLTLLIQEWHRSMLWEMCGHPRAFCLYAVMQERRLTEFLTSDTWFATATDVQRLLVAAHVDDDHLWNLLGQALGNACALAFVHALLSGPPAAYMACVPEDAAIARRACAVAMHVLSMAHIPGKKAMIAQAMVMVEGLDSVAVVAACMGD